MRQACARFVTWFTATRFTATIATLVTVPLICSGLYEVFWLSADGTGTSYGEHIRNYGLVILACWGGVIAVWRGKIATLQADEQRKATKQSDEQHRRSLLQTRLSQAVEQLKDDASEPVKIAGIRILARMPHDINNLYKEDALRMLEEFVRFHGSAFEAGEAVEPPKGCAYRPVALAYTGDEDFGKIDPLVQAAVRIVAEDELPDGLRLNLSGVNLKGADLHNAHLERADLSRAYLKGANLLDAYLEDAHLFYAQLENAVLTSAQLENARLDFACLEGTQLAGANLKGANLAGADLTNASIRQVKGLSQEQLDMACQYPDGPQPRVPDNLKWNEEKAKERWRECHS